MIMMTKIIFILAAYIFFLLIISCSAESIESEAKLAGLEFCSCFNKNKQNLQKDASRFCNIQVANKYRLLKIYFETRDIIESEIYNKKTMDSVYNFQNVYWKIIDSCENSYQ